MISRASDGIPQFAAIAGKIASGVVPTRFPASATGAWGMDRTCAVCDDGIGGDQAEVEAEFEDRTLPFHARCFVDWWRVAEANGGAFGR